MRRLGTSLRLHVVTVLFADISQFQTSVQWPKTTLPLVFLRASEGVSFRDSLFQTHRANAKARGIPTGVYHFLDHGQGAVQCANFLGAIGDLSQYVGFQLDIESKYLVAQDVADFMAAWRAHTNLPMLQYGPEGVLARCSGAKYGPLWLADYPGGGYPGDTAPEWRISFGGWKAPDLWQYGPMHDPAFPFAIDGDAYRGTLDQLLALMGAPSVTFENTLTPFVADFTPGGTLYKDAARTQVDSTGWAGGTTIGVAGVGPDVHPNFPDATVLVNLPNGTLRKLVYVGANHIVPDTFKVRPGTAFDEVVQATVTAAIAAQRAADDLTIKSAQAAAAAAQAKVSGALPAAQAVVSALS